MSFQSLSSSLFTSFEKLIRGGDGTKRSTSSSTLLVPYGEIRPHHIILGYFLFTQVKRWMQQQCWYQNLNRSITEFVNHYISSDAVVIPLIQRGYIPDFVIRYGIRLRLYQHLQQLRSSDDNTSNSTKSNVTTTDMETKMQIVHDLSNMPIAIATSEANAQHYEVPAQFYDMCLGPCKKYSSGYWPTPTTTFDESEVHMLQLYCERAHVTDSGMHIVDLGCGWGSLTLYLLEQYPTCYITSISNSHSQRQYIIETAKQRNLNLDHLTVLTCNVADDTDNVLSTVTNQDLVMTVEMLEHMKNYQLVLDKISHFLKPNTGQLFVHIFTHKDYAYHFDQGWMSDHFFTGGTMPSDDLLLYFAPHHFSIINHWRVNGTHYERTSNAWLHQLDKHWKNKSLQPVLAQAYGNGNEREWYINWRLFFLACAELWGYQRGEEWIVSHYLFQRR